IDADGACEIAPHHSLDRIQVERISDFHWRALLHETVGLEYLILRSVWIVQFHPSLCEARVRERKLRVNADSALEGETGLVVRAIAQGVAALVVPIRGGGCRLIRSVPVRIETPDGERDDEQHAEAGGKRKTRAYEQFGRAREGGTELRVLLLQS